RFLSDGLFLHVGFCDSWAVEPSRAWDFAFPEWWNIPARGISHFLSGGLLLRVGFPDSRAVDLYRAWDFAFPERWNLPARRILLFPSGGLFAHSKKTLKQI